MPTIRKGQRLTIKPEYLCPGESNLVHIAIEDSFGDTVRVEVADESRLRFKPINEWALKWVQIEE